MTFLILQDGFDHAPEVLVLAALLDVGEVIVLGFLPELEVTLAAILAQFTGIDGLENCATGKRAAKDMRFSLPVRLP